MKKVLFSAVAILLFAYIVWFFTAGKVPTSETNIPFLPGFQEEKKKAKHIVKRDFSGLQEKQPSLALKKIVNKLGYASYTFDNKLITLLEGEYKGEMEGKELTVTLSDVFFSPSDSEGNQITVILLSFEEKGNDTVAYYLVTRLPNGTLTNATFAGHDTYVKSATLKEGIITLKLQDSLDESPYDARFAMTKQKGVTTPIIVSLSENVVIK